MPREKHSFRSYSENVNILLTTESLVYPSVIHIKSEIFDYLLAICDFLGFVFGYYYPYFDCYLY